MGNGGSKPEQHVFNADAPVRFSQSVVDSLQKSPETDSSRAQDLELKVQSRVKKELTRLRDAQQKQLSDLTASLTTNPPTTPSGSSEQKRDPNSLVAHLSSPFYQDHSPHLTSSEGKGAVERTHDTVQKEIMDLRKKLDERKKVEKMSPAVEKAQGQLVACLRTNDRRPLDCWNEVEEFKREVQKMERVFVEQASR